MNRKLLGSVLTIEELDIETKKIGNILDTFNGYVSKKVVKADLSPFWILYDEIEENWLEPYKILYKPISKNKIEGSYSGYNTLRGVIETLRKQVKGLYSEKVWRKEAERIKKIIEKVGKMREKEGYCYQCSYPMCKGVCECGRHRDLPEKLYWNIYSMFSFLGFQWHWILTLLEKKEVDVKYKKYISECEKTLAAHPDLINMEEY